MRLLKTKTKRSVESLHHFRCVKCDKWWSIGDAPRSKTAWFCPWCGKKNEYTISRNEGTRKNNP